MSEEDHQTPSSLSIHAKQAWKEFKEHPVRTVLLGAAGSLLATAVIHLVSLGKSLQHLLEQEEHVTELRQQVASLSDELAVLKSDSGKELDSLGLKTQGLENRLSESENNDISVRIIEQRLGFSLPALNTRTEDLNNRMLKLETHGNDMNNRVLRLENRTEPDHVKAERFESRMTQRIKGAESAVQEFRDTTRRLENNVEELYSLHHEESRLKDETVKTRGVRSSTGGVEEKFTSNNSKPRAKGQSPGADLEGASHHEPPSTEREPQGSTPSAKHAADFACDGPVDPSIPASAVRRPKLEPKPAKPTHPQNHAPILRDLKLDLCLTVDVDGKVQDARIVNGQEIHEPFHREAMRACRRWRFEPARWKGQDIEWRERVVVVFRKP